jgi:hypothetical protein
MSAFPGSYTCPYAYLSHKSGVTVPLYADGAGVGVKANWKEGGGGGPHG